jgi:hypothetical protein
MSVKYVQGTISEILQMLLLTRIYVSKPACTYWPRKCSDIFKYISSPVIQSETKTNTTAHSFTYTHTHTHTHTHMCVCVYTVEIFCTWCLLHSVLFKYIWASSSFSATIINVVEKVYINKLKIKHCSSACQCFIAKMHCLILVFVPLGHKYTGPLNIR